MNLNELRRFFYELTALNPSEKRITIFLVTIIFLFVFLNSFHEKHIKSPIYFENIEADNAVSNSGSNSGSNYSSNYSSNYRNNNSSTEYNTTTKINTTKFYFDPNTASIDQLLQLGFEKRITNTIVNYRTKGGKFRKSEDLLKIYGMNEELFQNLKKFIKIPETISNSDISSEKYHYDEYSNDQIKNDQNSKQKTETHIHSSVKYASTIEVNAASIADFEKLMGIGPYLAKKIVNFRDKCGGFYSVDQVGETWGMPDSTFQFIRKDLKCDPALVRKINLNSATFEQLDLHPYITKALALDIINFRKKNGNFSQMEVLRSFQHIEDNYSKLLPYLTF